MENPGYDSDLSECVQRPDKIIDAGESAEDAADAGQRVGCDEDQARAQRAGRACGRRRPARLAYFAASADVARLSIHALSLTVSLCGISLAS